MTAAKLQQKTEFSAMGMIFFCRNFVTLPYCERPVLRLYDVGETTAFNSFEEVHSPLITTDSTMTQPIINGSHLLKEVKVTAKYTPAWWTAYYKENSVASYNVQEEADAVKNSGRKRLRYLTDILCDMDKNFYKNSSGISYNGKEILFISDPEFGMNGSVIDE